MSSPKAKIICLRNWKLPSASPSLPEVAAGKPKENVSLFIYFLTNTCHRSIESLSQTQTTDGYLERGPEQSSHPMQKAHTVRGKDTLWEEDTASSEHALCIGWMLGCRGNVLCSEMHFVQ